MMSMWKKILVNTINNIFKINQVYAQYRSLYLVKVINKKLLRWTHSIQFSLLFRGYFER